MSNVVNRPKRHSAKAELETHPIQQESEVFGHMAGGLLKVIRIIVFVVLASLRPPVRFVCNLVATPMLIAWLFSLYAFPDKHAMVWGFAAVSLGATALGLVYDFTLMAIAPVAMMMML